MRLGVLAVLLVSACATGRASMPLRSGLSRSELALVSATREKDDGGFARFWKARGVAPVGLLKWAEDRSGKVNPAPPALLDAIRDELGRLNQTPRKGEDVAVGVTVYRSEKRWFGRREVGVEVAGRRPSGELVWAGVATLTPSSVHATSAADSEEILFARELVAKLRKELGL